MVMTCSLFRSIIVSEFEIRKQYDLISVVLLAAAERRQPQNMTDITSGL